MCLCELIVSSNYATVFYSRNFFEYLIFSHNLFGEGV